MNERIKELAQQAKAFIIESEHAKIGEVSEVSFDKYSDLEKFAELIVRECARICVKEARQLGGRFCSDKIKDHFGVKE